MYHVLDVCRFIINYSNEQEYGISNLKLQKILYFVQAYFLINTKEKRPCFYERIEAWDFGPVVPEAYREYKQYGSSDIPMLQSFIKVDEENLWNTQRVYYDDDIVAVQDQMLIKAVIDKFADYSATDLVTITHHQAPWKDAYEPYRNNEITIDAIGEYFNS